MPITISTRSVNREFIRKVEEISGEQLTKCMQCGTCSGFCPMDASTEVSPRQMIHFTALGQQERVTGANLAWLCASCHVCEVRCPRGLDVPKIIEAIRLVTLRTNQDFIEPYEIDKETIQQLPQIALVSTFRKHTA